NSSTYGFTTGPDGNVWFTEEFGNNIGQVVIAAVKTTTTRLTASTNPSTVGQAVSFTAIVAPTSGAGTPTGTVTFSIDGTAQPPVNLPAVSDRAEATFTTSILAEGSHTISAAYSGDATFGPATSNTVSQVVQGVAPVRSVDGPTILSATLERPRGAHAA